MHKVNYSELTVKQLKNLLRSRALKIPYNATKAQLIDVLQSEPPKEPMNHKDEPKHDTRHDAKDEPKVKGLTEETDIQPNQGHRNLLEPVDKSDVRSFQTGTPGHPDGREMLSKEEARARGFHWLDTDDKEAKAKKG
jgi:hypothetical protein